jgi:hypothetical protein
VIQSQARFFGVENSLEEEMNLIKDAYKLALIIFASTIHHHKINERTSQKRNRYKYRH